MIKRITIFFCIMAMIITSLALPVFADSTNIVTIGQDLSNEQESFILNYFGVNPATTPIIYVNNQQEREYVGSWIPLEQIGNITISCAYVQPTTSGGIQVKTANLTYVTGNMIASVLSTAGVKNCNVVAAAPFPVSGTGALTGVMIAYQRATGTPLNQERRDLAVQEFTVTQQAAQSIGENEALQLVNAVKMEVIKQDVNPNDTDKILQIVYKIVDIINQNIVIDNSTTNIDNSKTVVKNTLSEEDLKALTDLATELAKQRYQYADVQETLERVAENLEDVTNIVIGPEKDSSKKDKDKSDKQEKNKEKEKADSKKDKDESASAGQPDKQESEPSILEDTHDEMIDVAYQSSTREEDIQAIEEELAAIEEAKPEEEAPYDMSSVEEYTEMPPEEAPAIDVAPSEELNPVVEDIPEEPAPEVYPEEEAQPEYTEPEYVEPVQEQEPFIEEPAFIPEEQLFPDEWVEEPSTSEEWIPEEPFVEEPIIEEQPMEEQEYIEPWDEETEPWTEETEQLPEEEDIWFDEPASTEVIEEESADNMEDPFFVEENDNDLWEEESSAEDAEAEEPEDASASRWTFMKPESNITLPEGVAAALEEAMERTYTPVAVLGSQVVSGTNYQILCIGDSADSSEEQKLYDVTVYVNLDWNASITNVCEFDLDTIKGYGEQGAAELMTGGWIAADMSELALPDDAKSVFEEAMGFDTEYIPAALLATKDNEYAILCYKNAEDGMTPLAAVAFITDNMDGTYNSCIGSIELSEYAQAN